MSFEIFSDVGLVHLTTAQVRRVVPNHERHRWLLKKLLPGQHTSCDKCGCVKTLTRRYETRYQPLGATFDTDVRPACTGVQRVTATTT
jgi:hypothetical protein